MIYLAQTDTTAGFLSQNLEELNRLKNRPLDQPCLICVSKFEMLKNFTRVPCKFKNLVRRAKKTTFIYPNKKAIRVIKDHHHSQLLDELGWAYSSSANLHGQKFDLQYAKSNCDVIIGEVFSENTPSNIYKLSKSFIRKIR
ncbi:Sua5/YciO/YrdC/YwlC family protein [Campylobacter fetus]|uniref:Sua5 YciO YrdC YwlC family protein n=1 Tax=Campylobacter fetus subsp. testudinum TaxID=1507806 RepID=A0AAX0HBB5_CAMFE|nr:Sua5/YciO/YrdC/YwlC family protein [Campylobacter fetus]ALV64309.1 threonylcarbamoyl-AMP synthase TsaC [Campylobacter fetus subsp. testudinum Sp3]AVK80593.1 Sua5 YciO YrdC YwlC family protein [Campylobacter fetus subsp. testudinum]EAK0830220.1 Sua5 YciO YrdC YwlC family protein [Campylobacter fetus]MPB72788.1 Sua5 YciO YrdC YwlC family protein [Campylobacter fetus]MPB76871.1 Sua5 YciO YrdC YwlC family protein [Campylobacter fetus]